jgi:SAM-dependent methyltransferase
MFRLGVASIASLKSSPTAMSSATSSKLQPPRPAEYNPNADEPGVLACLRCENNEWILESHHVLRCLSCRATLAIENNIVDCLQSGSTLSAVATEWGIFYGRNLKPYSVDADWWTLSCWQEYLFRDVIQDLAGKLIIDFGCGTAARVAALAPIQAHAYRYVGVDSSLEALIGATHALPGALFIHADLGSVRLKPERADIALCLGVLMYFKNFTEPLGRLLHALKPGGILLLHEQIHRISWTQVIRAFLASSHQIYPASYGIQPKELLRCLAEYGSTIRIHFSGSPLRRLCMKLVDGALLQPFRPFAAWMDSFWCATVGRVFPSLGASEIQVVFRKRDKPDSAAATLV